VLSVRCVLHAAGRQPGGKPEWQHRWRHNHPIRQGDDLYL